MNRIAKRPPEIFAHIVADSCTAPFWQAAHAGKLTCARCADCGAFRMPPTPFCPECLSEKVEWPHLPGTGTVYSFTVIERVVGADATAHTPYVVAVIDLDGAAPARLIANIVDAPLGEIAIGGRVRVFFEPVADDAAIPRFRLEK